MVLLGHILFNLAVAAVAEAILMPITSERMPFLYRVASKYLELVTSSNFWPFMLIICTDVARAVGRDLALFCADFHSIRTRSFYESFGEVLKFTLVFALTIDVVGEWEVAYWPTTNADGCVVVTECFLRDFPKEQVEPTPTVVMRNSTS